MTEFEERGLFWWHDKDLPQHVLAPDSAVPGLLKVDPDGLIILELDGWLDGDRSAMSVFARDEEAGLSGKKIEGLLKTSNKRIILTDLWKHGGRFSTNGMSYEGYGASHCLVGRSLRSLDEPILITTLEIELTKLNEWLRLGAITSKREDTTFTANYTKPGDVKYITDVGQIEIKYNLYGPMRGEFRDCKLELRQIVYLSFIPVESMNVEEAVNQFRLLHDLFVILTDSEYALPWPIIYVKQASTQLEYTLYFWRRKTQDDPPEHFTCPTNYIQLRERFGGIVANWLQKRQVFGPGFYLYLGLRRGLKLYGEHRFVNLIWGLEAFHRKKYPSRGASAEQKILLKTQRILDQIEKNSDRRWLKNNLKHVLEPTLEQRLYEIIIALPIELQKSRVQAFAKSCATVRNDISHYGANRHGSSYEEFLREAKKLSDALALLYHILILHEIGVDEQDIKFWVNESFNSFRNKSFLVAAKLLDPSVLKPASPPK